MRRLAAFWSSPSGLQFSHAARRRRKQDFRTNSGDAAGRHRSGRGSRPEDSLFRRERRRLRRAPARSPAMLTPPRRAYADVSACSWNLPRGATRARTGSVQLSEVDMGTELEAVGTFAVVPFTCLHKATFIPRGCRKPRVLISVGSRRQSVSQAIDLSNNGGVHTRSLFTS